MVADDVSRGLQLFFFLFVIDDGKLLFDFSVVCKHCVPHFLRICLRVVAGHRVIFGRNRFEKFGPCDHCFATKVSQKLLVDHLRELFHQSIVLAQDFLLPQLELKVI